MRKLVYRRGHSLLIWCTSSEFEYYFSSMKIIRPFLAPLKYMPCKDVCCQFFWGIWCHYLDPTILQCGPNIKDFGWNLLFTYLSKCQVTVLEILEEVTNNVTAWGVGWSTRENMDEWNCCRKNEKGRSLSNKEVCLLQTGNTLCWEKKFFRKLSRVVGLNMDISHINEFYCIKLKAIWHFSCHIY